MPDHIRCTSCETTLLAFESMSPKPIDRDDCPNCGGTEFEFLDG